jgi:hypothetical protein
MLVAANGRPVLGAAEYVTLNADPVALSFDGDASPPPPPPKPTNRRPPATSVIRVARQWESEIAPFRPAFVCAYANEKSVEPKSASGNV